MHSRIACAPDVAHHHHIVAYPRIGAVAASAALLLPACTGTRQSYGPLPVRNQHPAQLTVMHLQPAPAQPLREGAAVVRGDVAYSSLFLGGTGNGNGNRFVMDGELLRSELQFRLGLGGAFELGTTLPLAHAAGGFLDSFLIGYHEFFGFPSQGRDTTPKNQYEVAADFQGNRVYELESKPVQLADVPIELTFGVVAPEPMRPGLALRLGVELPTGDDDAGLGNGELDTAVGLASSWPLPFGTLHGWVQHTFAGNPDRAEAAGFEFADVTSAGSALELPLLADLSGLVQVEWETATLRDLEFDRAAGDQMLLWLGGRLRVDRDLFVELTFGEDLLRSVSPDFTIWIAMAWLPAAALGGGGDAAR